MARNPLQKLINNIDNGWDIKIQTEMRRLDLGEGRRFYSRIVWKAKKNDKTIESESKGFDTAEEAIADLAKKLPAAKKIKFKLSDTEIK